MPDRREKAWYQKSAVQAAFVAGAIGIALVYLRPEAAQQVVVIQPPPSVPAMAPATNPVEQSRPAVAPRNMDTREVPAKDRQPSASVAVPDTPSAQPVVDIGRPRSLVSGEPWFLSSLSTAITATFRETLGSQYVEIMVSPPGEASTRFPARNAGASGRFSTEDSQYEVQVLAIDWNRSQVNLIVRAVSAP